MIMRKPSTPPPLAGPSAKEPAAPGQADCPAPPRDRAVEHPVQHTFPVGAHDNQIDLMLTGIELEIASYTGIA